jgi:hypothetical protein
VDVVFRSPSLVSASPGANLARKKFEQSFLIGWRAVFASPSSASQGGSVPKGHFFRASSSRLGFFDEISAAHDGFSETGHESLDFGLECADSK